MNHIQKDLFLNQDKIYRDFQIKLIPTLDKDKTIGVRTPILKKYARNLYKENRYNNFLDKLPHKYFDENQLHAFLINEMSSFDICIKHVNSFLPYIDNWATCDQLSPKIFKNYKKELLSYVDSWLRSKDIYTVRFVIKMLMEHYLDEDFNIKYPRLISKIKSSEYYINMMIAWYFSTALAKQYDQIIPFIEKNKLDKWTHNKTIQKAVESYRIDDKQKLYLKTLKIK